ncbi:hypothetical protein JW848_00645 [Candidatus Bipolaricaulota bacterium]|nr:hypothetical protein [Candidatus Bipolaricaulota bacterium]
MTAHRSSRVVIVVGSLCSVVVLLASPWVAWSPMSVALSGWVRVLPFLDVGIASRPPPGSLSSGVLIARIVLAVVVALLLVLPWIGFFTVVMGKRRRFLWAAIGTMTAGYLGLAALTAYPLRSMGMLAAAVASMVLVGGSLVVVGSLMMRAGQAARIDRAPAGLVLAAGASMSLFVPLPLGILLLAGSYVILMRSALRKTDAP